MATTEKNITLEDLRCIPVGEPTTFVVTDPKKVFSIASMAYHLNSVESAESGRMYSCAKDYKKRRITVTVKHKTV